MAPTPVRFGRFSFAPDTGELQRDGQRIKLQGQPAKVLAVLIRHAGEVVSRDTLKDEVWSRDTHVDFERGLNFCIAQIRSALKDSAESPSYVETVPKQGYRFIARVESDGADHPHAPAEPSRALHPPPSWSRRGAAGLAVISIIVLGLIGWTRAASEAPTVVVVPFYNETGASQHAPLADAIGDATVARLASPDRIHALKVIGNADALQNPFARRDVQQIARTLDAQWVLIGQLKSDGQKQRIIAHLIRTSDMKHLWAQTFDGAFDLEGQARTAEAIAAGVTASLTGARN